MSGRPERHANPGTTEHADKAAQKAHSVPSAKRTTSKSAIRIAVIAALLLGLIVPWIAFLIWLAIVAIFGRPGGSVHLLQLSSCRKFAEPPGAAIALLDRGYAARPEERGGIGGSRLFHVFRANDGPVIGASPRNRGLHWGA
jgi:hypothetical protein